MSRIKQFYQRRNLAAAIIIVEGALLTTVAALGILPGAAQAAAVCHNERVQWRYWNRGDHGFIGHLRECGLPSHNQGINANKVGAACTTTASAGTSGR